MYNGRMYKLLKTVMLTKAKRHRWLGHMEEGIVKIKIWTVTEFKKTVPEDHRKLVDAVRSNLKEQKCHKF